jgi:phosphate acetyltransferase
MASIIVENRTFDELQPGDTATLSRTLTERDIRLFAVASGDLNPTHLRGNGKDSASLTGHAMWGASLLSGLLANELPGPGTVYRAQRIDFARPIRIDDTLAVSVTVRSKRPEDRLIALDCRGVNQRGEIVFEGTADVVAPDVKESVTLPEMPSVAVQQHDVFEGYEAQCAGLPPLPIAVAHPCDRGSLEAVLDATREGSIRPIVVAPASRIEAIAREAGWVLDGVELVDVPHSHAAAGRAVEIVREGRASALMKGSLHTDELMGAIVARDGGLRTARRVSHVFIMDVPTYHKALFVTDAAVNIAPTLEEKADIVANAVELANALGVGTPKVAVLSAVETINSKIATTLEAASLCKMAERGQIRGAIVDGPLAMDNAISRRAAEIKGIESPVAGDADILLVPDLEAGNILAKQLTFMANADAAGIVLGARVPVILTSRADSVRTRKASISVARLLVAARSGSAAERA